MRSDRDLIRAIWPLLLAAAVTLMPFTLFGTYLVAIAADAGETVATVGSLRGLGGAAALVVGFFLAPLLDTLSRTAVATVGLTVLAGACLIGAHASAAALACFCLLIGGATAVINPVLAASASDRFAGAAESARAATLVSATTSLTAMGAAPLIALPTSWWGWRTSLGVIALLAMVLAFALQRRPLPQRPSGTASSYRGSLRAAFSDRITAAALGISLLRTTAFMGWLAYAAAFFFERFGLGPSTFALVWSISGAAFFIGNAGAGRFLAQQRECATVTLVGMGAALSSVAAIGLFLGSARLPLALAGIAVWAGSHAVIAAAVTTLLVQRNEGQRGAVLGLNAAGQSLGVFLGAALVGWGLAHGSWAGVGVVLALLVGATLALFVFHLMRPSEVAT